MRNDHPGQRRPTRLSWRRRPTSIWWGRAEDKHHEAILPITEGAIAQSMEDSLREGKLRGALVVEPARA